MTPLTMKVSRDTFDELEQRVYRPRVSTEEREAKTKGEEMERGRVVRTIKVLAETFFYLGIILL